MAKKTISNTFTVSTVEDGESAPYYFQEWFAWSNDASTSSVTTAPNIAGSWATSIPAQGAYAYLWRKSIRYVWNENTRQYSGETAQYFRMSGLDGTSIKVKGTILGVAHSDGEADSYSAQTVEGNKFFIDIQNYSVTLQTYSNGQWSSSSPSDGDAYTSSGDGHLYMYSQEAGHVIDLGLFQGQNGKTYYTHIAWATNVVYSGGVVTSVEGFVETKSPNDTTHLWMGVRVNESSGVDPSDATLYTWSYTKGVQGNKGADAPYIQLSRSTILYQADNNGYSFGSQNFAITYSLKVKGNTCTISSTSNISISLPSYVSVVSGTKTTSGCTINCASSRIMKGVITITITGTYDGVTYTATGTITVDSSRQGAQGEPGEHGKVGRFFYFGGTFNSADTTQTFIVNDAQAPYFEHVENRQKRYHVFNYDTNGTYTMAQMWAISSNWNYIWEVMTDNFKYLITEALFGAYAHLGSWIFNSDYMLSEKDANGNPRGQQEYNGMGDSQLTSGFIPSIAFDALNGRASFGGDKVRFNPDGSGWIANKNIEWYNNGNAEFTGKVTANSGNIAGNLDVTGGFNVKSGTTIVVTINGLTDSTGSGNGNITILDTNGLYIKRGNEGFRLTTDGFQRWNSSANSWVNFYGGRYVRTVTSFNFTILLNDDLIIAIPYSSDKRAYLPSSNVPDGKIITIINAGAYGFWVNGNGHKIVGASEYSEVALNINDRMEFIYSLDSSTPNNSKWYANYMPKVDNES